MFFIFLTIVAFAIGVIMLVDAIKSMIDGKYCFDLMALFLGVVMITSGFGLITSDWICSDCQTKNTIYAKECQECGCSYKESQKKYEKLENEVWICPECKKVSADKFCSDCGTERIIDKNIETWICSYCKNKCTGKFCSKCGKERSINKNAEK